MGKHTSTDAKSKSTVIDMRGHLLGRVCGIVAKKLQNGEKITLVRCEETNMSGSHYRHKLMILDFLRKRTLTNPGRGPFHHRAPSDMVERTIRGMISKNHRNHAKRLRSALQNLRTYEGIPKSLERTKRMLCPAALRNLRLAPKRDYCRLGKLSKELGWQQADVIDKLETERKERALKYHASKMSSDKMWRQSKVEANKELPKQAALLAKFGY